MNRLRWMPAVFLPVAVLQAAALTETLQLPDLIAEALARNPELQAAQAASRAALERPSQARALPDPVFSPSYLSGGGLPHGTELGPKSSSHIGAMISQELPVAGKRRLRGEIASKEAAAALQEYQLARLGLIARVKQAYHRLQYTHAAIELISRERDLLRRLRRSSDTPYFLGQSAQDAQVAYLDLRVLELGQEQHRLADELNALRARPPDDPLPPPPPLSAPPPPEPLAELSARALRSAPLVRLAYQQVERDELGVELARKQYWPDPTLSLGYYRLHTSPDVFELRADVAIPLHRRDRQDAHLAERRAALEEARFRAAAAERELLREIGAEYLRAHTAAKQMSAYADRIIPESKKALNSYLSGYEGGVIEFMAVQESFKSTLEYQLGYLDQVLDLCLAVDRLEALTGPELYVENGS